MKYCLNYNIKSKLMNEIDEIKILFNKKNISSLIDFIKEHQKQRIILNLETKFDNDIKEIVSIIKENNLKITICFSNSFIEITEADLALLTENNIPYFFHTFVTDWETLNYMVNIGVSDIYIMEDLCFNLKDVQKITSQHNIKIRTYPNLCQLKYEKTYDLVSFFIRPEDVNLYEGYIDVLEFFGDREKQEEYYNIYKKEQKWFGKLNEIIIGMNNDIDNRFIIPRFGEKRLSCGRKCFKGGNCDMCKTIYDLSKQLEKGKLLVRYNKEGENINEGSNNETENNE